MRPAILVGHLKIPVERLDMRLTRKVKRELVYSYCPMGAEETIKVPAYFVDGDYLCVPRQYGLKLCNQLQIEFEDQTSEGAEASWPKLPTPLDYQVGPLQDIEDAFDSYYDVLFRAHTGWGKTIGSLITAAKYNTATLIIVDQDNLKEQWYAVLTNPKLFGFKPDEIGMVQGNKETWQGKAVTIAMVQTLVKREYSDAFYYNFGFVVGDEVHTLGAPTFSQTLFQFPAARRLYVSATPKRKDGLQRALDHHCGPIRVAADKQHDESSVYILRNPTVYSWYANISPKVGRIINEVSEDAQRNLMIAEAAMWLVESGRPTLILSDRVEHLKELKYLLVYLGVDEDEIGLYTGYDPVWKFTKDPNPVRQPKGLHRWVDAEGKRTFAPYSAVSMQQKEPKVPKRELARIEKECSYVMATFGKFAKGTDVPRLAGGIDATPRSTAEQAQGRILRKDDGKLKPIWVTIVDEGSYRLLYSFTGRLGEYLKSNSRLYEWDGQGDTSEWNIQQLRSDIGSLHAHLSRQEIIECGRGRYKLAPPGTKKRQEADAIKARLKPRTPRRA